MSGLDELRESSELNAGDCRRGAGSVGSVFFTRLVHLRTRMSGRQVRMVHRLRRPGMAVEDKTGIVMTWLGHS